MKDYNKLHRKQLLDLLRNKRAIISKFHTYGFVSGLTDNEIVEIENERKVIYDILNTREHIPNKQETLKTRQQRGRTKRNQGKKRCQ